MVERVFSRKCGKCRQRAMELATVPYTTQIDHDGRKYTVTITDLVVPRCANCGTISLDDEANRQISAAFRKQAGLLSPEQIRSQRLALGLTQQALADLLGVAVFTLSRWETGAQIQQRSLDRFLRAFFKLPELREALQREEGLELPEIEASAADAVTA
jgi:putative zinc finger/helix-turn-helix YgiT family protein